MIHPTYVEAELLKTGGNLADAARNLGVPLHTLNTIVKGNARLQSIILSMDVEIANLARVTVLNTLRDETEEMPVGLKAKVAMWALEHLQSDEYSRKVKTEDVNVTLQNLPREKLREKLREAEEKSRKLMEVDVPFEEVELFPEDNPLGDTQFGTMQLLEHIEEKETANAQFKPTDNFLDDYLEVGEDTDDEELRAE